MNEMIKAIMEDFTANFVPDAECLYLCNRKARDVRTSIKSERTLLFSSVLSLYDSLFL